MVLLCGLGIPRMAVRRNPALLTGGRSGWLDHFLPERHQALFQAIYTPRMALSALREWQRLDEAEEAVRQAGSLGDLPLRVLSRTLPELDGWGYSDADKAKMWKALQESQAALVQLSSRAKQVAVPDVGHMIYVEQPDVVVAAIREVLDEIGRGQPEGCISRGGA